jgi:uroporphyrinogen decarboxylase
MGNASELVKHLRRGILPPLGSIPAPVLDALAVAASLRGRVSELSSVERALAALRHREADRVPVTPMLCAASRQLVGASFPEFAQEPERAAEAFTVGLDIVGGDLVVLMLDLSVEAADFGQAMVFPADTTPHPDYAHPRIRDVEDYRALPRLELAGAERMQRFVGLCRAMVRRVGLRAVVTGFLFGPLGVLGMMRGAEQLFGDCMRHPQVVRRACDTVTEVLVQFAEAQCDTGVPAVAIDTLFASRNGLPKALWESIEGPGVREISAAIKRRGRLVGVHNCGHAPYFDAQIRTMAPDVISFAHLPDDCASDAELKQRYGDQVTLLGYLPTALLVRGTAAEVLAHCRRQIDALAPGGGYVLAPGCEYPPNAPLTNAFAIVHAAKRHG